MQGPHLNKKYLSEQPSQDIDVQYQTHSSY